MPISKSCRTFTFACVTERCGMAGLVGIICTIVPVIAGTKYSVGGTGVVRSTDYSAKELLGSGTSLNGLKTFVTIQCQSTSGF